MDASENQVLQFIAESPSKVSFACLQHRFCKACRKKPEELKRTVAGLIQSGKLCYTSHFGRSFIEISYGQPRLVSEHVVLKPRLTSWNATAGQLVVTLERGAAFGGGEHPTTRLAIQLIDASLHLPHWLDKKQARGAIDIGTGSGILAIVAAKMGLGFVCGIDTDPCAVFEARDNVRLNHLENRINILNADIDAIPGSYDLVLANLRAPTLFGLRSVLDKKVTADSTLIFSGLKTDEVGSICDFYEEAGFFMLQNRSEKGWSAICLTRGALSDEKPELMPGY